MVFDGRLVAREIKQELKVKVEEVRRRLGRRLKVVVILDRSNKASLMYTRLKARVAEELGVDFQVISDQLSVNQCSRLVNQLNKDVGVNGIMIQMPFPDSAELIKLIDPKKDVDGLREDSPFRPAVVRAVLEILGDSLKETPYKSVLVVGAKGFVGRRLMRELRITNYELLGMDKDDFDPEKLKKADVVISCTGQAGLIKPEMVKEGFVAIDVGYPGAEFTTEALAKASYYTPVPGGVGPVTVACLFKNLVDAVQLENGVGGS